MAGKRNRIFDEDLITKLVDYIKVGNYLGVACAAVGITEGTYYRWLRWGQEVEEIISGRDDEEDLREELRAGILVLGLSEQSVRAWNVREDILQATAMGEAYAVAMVRQQMPQQWTAAMTFLERRFPGRWKRREQIEVGNETEQATGIDESLLLKDPTAVRMLHDVLDRAARGTLPAPDEVIDATVVGDDDKGPLT